MRSLALLPLLLFSQDEAEESFAIVHANVIPMDEERILEDHTVVVEGDRIVAVGPSSELRPKEDSIVIDATGQYLMPGLVDFHVHNWNADDHVLFLANGVTTIRNLFGAPLHLTWRAEIEAGERIGPTILTAGPIVDGDPPIWPGSAVVESDLDGYDVVAEQAEAGYDFIKVYNRIPLEAYEAIVAAAEEVGLPVMGHVPDAVGLDRVLEARQRTIEHLTGYEDVRDLRRIPELVEKTKENDVYNCVTLIVMQKFLSKEKIEEELKLDVMRYVDPFSINTWKGMAEQRASFAEATAAGETARMAWTRRLHEAGAPLVLGTDMGNPWVLAGFAVHQELQNLITAGLTPYEALRTATVAAAECMRTPGEFGTIAPEARADLLLLSENPLEDVGNATSRVGVMARGRWYPAEELDTRLEELAERYGH